jgi:hypothetical protein
MNRLKIVLIFLLVSIMAGNTFGFRLFTPSNTRTIFSRPSWEAGPGNWPLRPRGDFTVTINGIMVTVHFGAGGVAMTAQQVADAIQAAIDAQAPGTATVSVVGSSLGSGAVRIEALLGTITDYGGAADSLDLHFNTQDMPPSTTIDPWDAPPFVHWDLREFPNCEVPYAVNPNATNAAINDAALIAAVQAAFTSWQNVVPALIQFTLAQPAAWNPGQNYFVNDGWNVVSWVDLGYNGYSGLTRFRWNNRTGALMESDIALNDNGPYMWGNAGQDWANDLDPGPALWLSTDVQGVASHEIGHFIGLAHVPGPGSPEDPTMSYGNAIWGQPGTAVPSFQLRSLSADDRDGCNFLYTPDLGDAPDPAAAPNFYPSKVHGPIQWATLNDLPLFQPNLGADHFFGIRDSLGSVYRGGMYEYEWLGPSVNDAIDECEAKVTDMDTPYDDGVNFLFDWFGNLVGVRFLVSTNGRGPARYSTAAGGRRIYVNGWLDSNNDKDWGDPGERLVDWSGGPGNGGWGAGDSRTITQWFAPTPWPDGAYFRMRLDWGEQVGRTRMVDFTLNASRGAAQLGEVEDYPKSTPIDPFHGWHCGYDYYSPSSWPYWSYPGVYEVPGSTTPTISINTPWWWHCYTFPPPVESFFFGVALPPDFVTQGWQISNVSFKEYAPGSGGTVLATLASDDSISVGLNADYPMDDGSTWYGFSIQNYVLPDTTMVLYYELTAPPTWNGYISGDLHFVAGDSLFGISPEPYLSVPVTAGQYLCGDADGSGNVSIGDAVMIVNYIFGGGPAPNPLVAADADCSGGVSIGDAVYLINFIFGGGPAPCLECP